MPRTLPSLTFKRDPAQPVSISCFSTLSGRWCWPQEASGVPRELINSSLSNKRCQRWPPVANQPAPSKPLYPRLPWATAGCVTHRLVTRKRGGAAAEGGCRENLKESWMLYCTYKAALWTVRHDFQQPQSGQSLGGVVSLSGVWGH